MDPLNLPQPAGFVPASPNQIAQAMKEQFGRHPLPLDMLLVLVNAAGWPTQAIVHPLDFFFMTRVMAPVHKDAEGPYFYLSSTKIRPAPGADETLNLQDWLPEEEPLIRTSFR